MIILSRPEKERLVLELYSKGKSYREIAKEARISPRDIGRILNKSIVGSEKEKKVKMIIDHFLVPTNSFLRARVLLKSLSSLI
jgi:DNA invertase Pin-like site-specific DNA recombinase